MARTSAHQTTHVLTFTLAAVLIAASIGFVPRKARAEPDIPEATLIVTTLLDKIDPNDGFCSLREAMQRAFDNSLNNAVANDCPQSTTGNTQIQIGIPGTILISNGVDGGQLPNIHNIVTIMGPVTIDASKADQILFDVESDGKLNLVNVKIKNAKWTAIDSRGELRVAGGSFENNSAGGAGGGAIRNDGVAMIAGVSFINNKAVKKDANEGAKDGGAIRSTWVLTVAGSTFTGNVSDNQGGAIMVQAGRLEIVDSAFTGNVTEGSFCANNCLGNGGGAIATASSGNVYPFTIKRTAFQANVALKGVGGAIYHSASTLMTITDASFQANHAGSPGNLGAGGAIRNINDMNISRSTFTANSVEGDGGAISTETSGGDHILKLRMVGFAANNASGKGGAIASMSLSSSVAKIDAKGVQITGNVAGDGGGIFNQDSKYDKAEFKMSVWANLPQNCKDGNPLDDNLPKPAESNPPIDSKGQNSFSDNSCDDDDDDEQDKETDAINPDPMLAAPAYNGGTPGLMTQKPLPGSPLIDKIEPANNDNDPDTQQDIRGMQRPMNGDGIGLALFDIGPFEADDATPKFASLPPVLGTVDVGSVAQGQAYSKVGALKVFNGGDATLNLSASTLGGTHAGNFVVSGLPVAVGANGSNSVDVQCTPSAQGTRTATLSFTTNDPLVPEASYTLTCNGVAPATPGYGSSINPPGPLARNVTLGTPASINLPVQETGGAQLTLSNPQLISNPPGAITLQTAFPVNIANGGAAQNIGLQCAAAALGVQTATFTFATNDPAKPTVSYNVTCTVNKAADLLLGAHFSTNAGLGNADGVYGIAISPDGKHVYAADAGDSRIATYSVNANYSLQFVAGFDSASLDPLSAFTLPYQVAVSADGNNVYATGVSGDSIAAFTRDGDTGTLTHLVTVRNGDGYGCSAYPAGCSGTVAGLDGAYGIAISPDGQYMYVSSHSDSSIVVLKRNTGTGALGDKSATGSGAFFVQRFTHPQLTAAYGVAVSADGANVYVTGYSSDTLLTLKRDATTGQLSHLQTLGTGDVSNLNGVFRAVTTADGSFVYTASYDSDAICQFRRNATDGKLTPIACNTSSAYLNAASDIALTPDGQHLLATAYASDNVAAFGRNLTSGFLSFQQELARDGGTGLPGLDGARGIVVHPNGKAAFATGFVDDMVISLPFNNPKPVALSVNPASKAAGSGDTFVTVNGIDFTLASVVKVNGVNRSTFLLNDTQLSVQIPASDLAAAGDLALTVQTSGPGGGTSNALVFSVVAPGSPAVPSIESTSVNGLLAGGAGVTIDVFGSGFEPSAVVLWNGQSRPTTRVSDTHLQATLSASDLAAVGPIVISVSNVPVMADMIAQGGEQAGVASSKSNLVSINVVNPNQNVQPGITQIAPSSMAMLSLEPVIEVTINGTGFTVESVAYWDNEPRPTQFVNGTTLKVAISAGDLTASRFVGIKVVNPSPGGGESNVKNFVILGPVPQVMVYRRFMPIMTR